MREKWEDVRVSVIRDGFTDPDGPCANAIPQDDDKATSLQNCESSAINNFIN